MKPPKAPVAGFLLSIFVTAVAAADVPAGKNVVDAAPGPTTTLAARGAHHRLWHTVTPTVQPDGTVTSTTNQYHEIANGLCYPDPQRVGEWLDTAEAFRIVPEGAIADQGPHTLRLSGDIAAPEPVTFLSRDGKTFVMKPWALAYYDVVTGKQALIAQVKSCPGVVVDPSAVAYLDAFTDCEAAIRFTYTRSGIEQDVVLFDEGFGRPENYGMNSQTAVMEMWTEILEAPVPTKAVHPVQGLNDETLNFGEAEIVRGRAFTTGIENDSVPVIKSWIEVDGRTFLVEAVRYPQMRRLLDTLDAQAAIPNRKRVANPLKDREALVAQLRNGVDAVTQIASIAPMRRLGGDNALLRSRGVVLDYQILNGTLSTYPYTFKADETYFLSGSVYLDVQTTIESGAILKYAAGAFLHLNSGRQLNFHGSPYRPVIFTAKDDNSVGQVISGSTGSPAGYFYANPALRLGGNSQNSHSITNFRVCYAQVGLHVTYDGPAGTLVRHGQFLQCQTAIKSDYGSPLKVQNALFQNVGSVFTMYYANVNAEHLTVNTANSLHYGSTSSTLTLKNSLLVALSSSEVPGFGRLK